MSKTPRPSVPTDPADLLTHEDSFYQIWQSSRHLRPGWFNLATTVLLACLLIAFVLLTSEPIFATAERMRSWADTGSGFAISILGFLIAGFTVFATITKPELFIAMAKKENEKYHIDYLRYSFYSFMQVFIHFMLFLGLCFAIKMLASTNGPISVLLFSFSHLRVEGYSLNLTLTKVWLIKAGLVITGAYMAYCLLLLKSFILTTYKVTLLSIAWSWSEELGEKGTPFIIYETPRLPR